MGLFIQRFALLACGFYIFSKLLNLNKTSKRTASNLIFSLVVSFFMYYIAQFFQYLSMPILIILFLTYVTLSVKIDLGLSITVTTIAFGLNFIFYSLSSVLVAIIFHFLEINRSGINKIYYIICISLMQFLLSSSPWKFRRQKRGMPFLKNKGGGNIGVLISTIVLCCIFIIINGVNPKSIMFIMPFIFVFFCGVLIFLWWRNRLKKTYIEQLKSAELKRTKNMLRDKNKQVEELQKKIDYLEKVIHKDNKLIPTMELMVREHLQFTENGKANEIQINARKLLEQLKSISCERAGIIKEYGMLNEKLILTGVSQIDALMAYMFRKAKDNHIKFNLTISGSIKYMVENIIPLSDLRALLADLTENSIIATQECEIKNILVSLGILDGYYTIEIFDSGIPFEPETLVNFGRKKTTTHADSGGSGIGLMTIYEISNNYGASIIIDEFPNNRIFTKKLSIRFDNSHQYIVKTKTPKKVRAISARKDLALHNQS